VVIVGGEIVSNRVDPPAPPKPAEAAPTPPPVPVPKREQRHDGPPAEGERQIRLLGAGTFNLPDGSQAKIGDCVNVPAEVAQKYVERGVANFVDIASETPAAVEGVFAADIDLPFSEGGSR